MRVLGVDFGQRRIGLAVSDPTASLARPWRTVSAGDSPVTSAAIVADLITSLGRADDDDVADLQAIVVGVPRKLGGEPTEQTEPARAFAHALASMTGLAVHEQDERLSSQEADALLKVKERDWRRRKDKLDAAAAAVILQDYLDARARTASAAAEPPVG